MRLLIDNALSPSLADRLRINGHDAVHVRDRSLQSAEDSAVFELAIREVRVVVSADTDFGTLLALRGARRPSVVLFRRGIDRRPAKQLLLLMAHMAVIERAVVRGAIVVLQDTRVRIRYLPVLDGGPGALDNDFEIRDRPLEAKWIGTYASIPSTDAIRVKIDIDLAASTDYVARHSWRARTSPQ